MKTTKKLSDYSGYSGSVDVDLKTSLFEYGLIHKQEENGDFKFIYGVSPDENRNYFLFDYGFYNEIDFADLIENSWFSLSGILSSVGMTKDEWLKLPLPSRIFDCIAYYGHENIFGSSYTPFEIIDCNRPEFESKP